MIGQDPCAPQQTLRWRGGTVRLQNDLFADADSDYTNGVATALVSHDMDGRLNPDRLPRPLGLCTRLLDGANPELRDSAGTESTSQNVVMRKDIERLSGSTEDREDVDHYQRYTYRFQASNGFSRMRGGVLVRTVA